MQTMRAGCVSRALRFHHTWSQQKWWHCNTVTGAPSSFLDHLNRTSAQTFPIEAPACNGILTSSRHAMSTYNSSLTCHDLDQRALLRISGSDTLTFLQGLITNDTRLLEEPKSVIYALMLNIQGRVLYDLLLYNVSSNGTPTVLMECDRDVLPELRKLMKMYKIRKKVDISEGSEYQSCAVLPSDGNTAACEDTQLSTTSDVIMSALDPRVPQFGWRMIVPAGMDVTKAVTNPPRVLNSEMYAERRYRVGLGEGTRELPPGACFPLESNGHFLNGVSFSKGCYIGQELTSRTHHIGVTRKRLMPIVYDRESHTSHSDDKVENSLGKNSGRVKGISGKYGLALLRLPNVLGDKKSPLKTVRDDGQVTGSIETFIPDWWQKEHDPILRQILGIPQP